MCAPGCKAAVERQLSRRGFVKSFTAATAAAGSALALSSCAHAGGDKHSGGHKHRHHHMRVDNVADLSHPLTEDFPTFSGEQQLEVELAASYAKDYYNENSWTLMEHTGTHMDAPIHFSTDGLTMDAIPVSNLVAPLAIVDISVKAQDNADAQLTVEDLQAWESQHGPIPKGACVAMHSGWGRKVNQGRAFRNADASGVMHFPGFHVDAALFLLEERDCKGIAVDTLSLDFGPSQEFAVHYSWLPTNRWGMECVANLEQLPASGATLVVGAPKVVGATGGPSRLIALY